MSDRIHVVDCVRFVMPRDREYQFAACAVMQKFVNLYTVHKANEDLVVSGGRGVYELHYELDMPYADVFFFEAIGLELIRKAEKLIRPTMVVDFSDAKLESFRTSGLHISEVCGFMCGTRTGPLPKIRRVNPSPDPQKWLYAPPIERVMGLKDGEVMGIVAAAGPETYLAAAMGLAVVELVEPDEPLQWRSKWINVLYRRVRVVEFRRDVPVVDMHLIDRAQESIYGTLQELLLCSRPQLVPEVQIQSAAMEHTPFTVGYAEGM
jgi:hypothetical protein